VPVQTIKQIAVRYNPLQALGVFSMGITMWLLVYSATELSIPESITELTGDINRWVFFD
jgi:hypothetical protein